MKPEEEARKKIDQLLEDSDKLPPPEIIASEITDNLESALEQFNSIRETLQAK